MILKFIIFGAIGYAIWYYFDKMKKRKELPKQNNNQSHTGRKEKFCRECGATLEDGIRFCATCGTKVEDIKTYRKKSPINKEPK